MHQQAAKRTHASVDSIAERRKPRASSTGLPGSRRRGLRRSVAMVGTGILSTSVFAQTGVTIDAVAAVEIKSSVSMTGVANEGFAAVGHEEFWPTGLWTAIEWSPEEGSSYIEGDGPLPGMPSGAEAISSDGLVIVGGAYFDDVDFDAYRWSPWGGFENLGHPVEFDSSWSSGVSSDGSVVVGTCGSWTLGDSAFRWTEKGGMQLLDVLPGAIESVAYGVSGDGVVVVGESGDEACRWVGGVPEALGLLVGQIDSAATAISEDGQVVVGDSGNRAFRWTADGGMQDLGLLPGATWASAHSVSGDGSVIVGDSGFRAFIWTEALGMTDLSVYLAEVFELELSGFVLASATAVSADGTAITGQGGGVGWVIRGLPAAENPGCVADLNQDGIVDATDLSILLSEWKNDCCGSDLDGDGSVDSADLTILLAAWGLLCPGA